MKTLLFAFLTCFATQITSAAVARIELRGLISETNLGSVVPGAPIAVGDEWVATFEYPYPSPGTQGPFPGLFSFVGAGPHTITIGASSWHANTFTAAIDSDGQGGPAGQQLEIGSPLPTQPAFVDSSGSSFRFQSPQNFMSDLTALPGSLSQWNLPQSEFFTFGLGGTANGANWVIGSRQLQSARIEIIPEPATCASAFVGSVVLLLRRRRKSMFAV